MFLGGLKVSVFGLQSEVLGVRSSAGAILVLFFFFFFFLLRTKKTDTPKICLD